MFRVERNGNAPVESCAGNAQILQTLFNKVNHLVAAGNRLNKIRMGFNIFQNSILIFGQFKEITFFRHFFYRAAAVRAFAVYKLAFQPVRFARNAVQTFIILFINVALVINFLQYSLHYFMVAFFAGADKIIVGNVQHFPQFFKVGNNRVNILNRRNAFFGCFALNFQAVFVAAG